MSSNTLVEVMYYNSNGIINLMFREPLFADTYRSRSKDHLHYRLESRASARLFQIRGLPWSDSFPLYLGKGSQRVARR